MNQFTFTERIYMYNVLYGLHYTYYHHNTYVHIIVIVVFHC